jgi:hypothetical protein
MLPVDVLALALTVIVAGAVKVLPLVGAVRLTVGGVAAGGGAAFTVTLTGADCAVNPALSVTMAVSEYVPAATLVHDRLNGALVSVAINVAPV